jgi:hypothetical protein
VFHAQSSRSSESCEAGGREEDGVGIRQIEERSGILEVCPISYAIKKQKEDNKEEKGTETDLGCEEMIA